ncbi:MAG TPA: rod-binding protein [Rhizomicrobium sp.]|jgi:Rod binding domain-containing protein|nr:rod-binding protein [Rhizomicrobium sp.]
MDTGLSIAGNAMTALQMQPVAQPSIPGKGAPGNMAAIDKAASEFESVFISQFLGAMFSGIKSDGITGGGDGEQMFRSLMLDQYAQGLQGQGGFGLAAQVKAQMLKMQES